MKYYSEDDDDEIDVLNTIETPKFENNVKIRKTFSFNLGDLSKLNSDNIEYVDISNEKIGKFRSLSQNKCLK